MTDVKEKLEVQELAHNRIKIWLAIVGVFLTIVGLSIERWSYYEQRQSELTQKVNAQRLARMTEIGVTFDSLSARTIRLLVQAKTDISLLALSTEEVRTSLEQKENQSDLEKLFLNQLEELSKRLYDKKKMELKEWHEAIQLQAEWESRENGFTPDFEIYFGKEAHQKSMEVARSAWASINNNFVGEGSENLKDFKDKYNYLSGLIRTKIIEKNRGLNVSKR